MSNLSFSGSNLPSDCNFWGVCQRSSLAGLTLWREQWTGNWQQNFLVQSYNFLVKNSPNCRWSFLFLIFLFSWTYVFQHHIPPQTIVKNSNWLFLHLFILHKDTQLNHQVYSFMLCFNNVGCSLLNLFFIYFESMRPFCRNSYRYDITHQLWLVLLAMAGHKQRRPQWGPTW